eukprot:CAMPEP_0174262142 /NCGR_PEP_ID=MMETSP0439-20130205/12797_1 /TAXON_ID=0 /ORGANISM="Stereomyxa ramosa, Strain Chinc5" /LENGTH=425 /DNA_ID=CAMNT_0015346795 /DNA_START=17 /DNA_END=1291 /DNA_ORIENTATION=+
MEGRGSCYLIRGCMVYVDGSYHTADVTIKDSLIASVEFDPGASNPSPQTVVVNGENKLLIPGFVNAHTHSSEIWVRGEIDMFPLELWLAHLWDYGAYAATPEHIYYGCLHNGLETLKSGGTTIMDHLAPIPGKLYETVEQAVKAYRDLGIRAYISPLIRDLPLLASIPQSDPDAPPLVPDLSHEEILEQMERCVIDFHRPEEGINIGVGPTGLQMCSDDLFRGCVALSEKYNLVRHTHCLESRAQKKLCTQRYGCSAVEHLQKLGFLGEKTSCAHTVWLNDNDIEIFKETGTTAVHNALSNIRLGSGIAPVLKYLKAGVNVAIGCDGSASNDSQDMMEAIKIGMLLHNVTDPDYRKWIKPTKALEMASHGGAVGVGEGETMGSLEVDKKADLLLFDLTKLSVLPRTSPIGLLVMGRPTNVLHSVW